MRVALLTPKEYIWSKITYINEPKKKPPKNHKEGIGNQQSNLAAILCKNSKQLKSQIVPLRYPLLLQNCHIK